MFAFVLFTEGFGYWKAFLSCEAWKLKLIQSSLNTDMSTKKLNQYNTDPIIVLQEKSDDFDKILTTETDSEPDGLQLPTSLASLTKSVDNTLSSLHKNTDVMHHTNGHNAIGNHTQETEKKQSTAKPLKVITRRYSTKIHKRHHVEEAEADLHSEESSESDNKKDVAK